MPFDFDTPIDRTGTWASRWERYAGRDVIPLWVADTDFRAPPAVLQAFAARVRTVSQEPTFTPYFALTERDRSRLSYVAEITLTGPEASGLPAGVPVRVTFPGLTTP